MLIVKLIREKQLLSIKMKCDCQMVRKHIQAQDINSNQTFHVETVVCLGKIFSKPKDYIQIGIDAEDYYRIKESEKKSG